MKLLKQLRCILLNKNNQNEVSINSEIKNFEYNLARAKYFADTIQITSYEETMDYLCDKVKQSEDDFNMIKYLTQNNE